MVSPSEIGTLLKVKIYLSWASLHQSVKAFNKEESVFYVQLLCTAKLC